MAFLSVFFIADGTDERLLSSMNASMVKHKGGPGKVLSTKITCSVSRRTALVGSLLSVTTALPFWYRFSSEFIVVLPLIVFTAFFGCRPFSSFTFADIFFLSL